MTGHTPTSELQDGLMGGCHIIGVFADVIQILFLLEENMMGFFFFFNHDGSKIKIES